MSPTSHHTVNTHQFNDELKRILNLLLQSNPSTVGNSLKIEDGAYTLLAGSKVLVKILGDSIQLLGRRELKTNLIPEKPTTQVFGFEANSLRAFFEDLSPAVVRLNHMGISYYPEDSDKDIKEYQALLKDTGLDLYIEPAESEHEQWLFVGDRNNWADPLFELVMNKPGAPYADYWIPHFQIDIDTTLSIEQLEKLTEKHLGKGFFKWKFDIKDYGVVLATGKLADIHGSKIYLALGTNLRGTEWHRREGLKDFN